MEVVLVMMIFLLGVGVNARNEHIYNYKTEVCVTSNNKEDCQEKCVVEGELAVTTSSQEEERIHSFSLSRPLIGCNGGSIEQTQQFPFGVLVENDKVKEFYVSDQTSEFLANVQVGIARMFEVSAQSSERRKKNGEVEIIHKWEDEHKLKITKVTQKTLHQDPSETLLGVNKIKNSEALLQFSPEKILQKMNVNEILDIKVTLKSSLGAKIFSTQSLLLDGSVELDEDSKDQDALFKKDLEKIKSFGKTISGNILPTPLDKEQETGLGKFVDNNFVILKKSNLATKSAASVFQEAIRKIQESPSEEIKKVLLKKKNQQVLPQLLDALGSAGTPLAHKMVMEAIPPKQKNQKDLERYFIALGIHGRGNDLVDAMFETVKNIPKDRKELKETALYALCSVAGKSNIGTDMINEIIQLGGGKKECTDSVCHRKMIKCITALGDHSYLGKILQHVKSKKIENKIKELSLKTLGKSRLIQPEQKSRVESELLKIYLQKDKKFDSTQRMNALDSILDLKPDTTTIINLIDSLNPNEKEISCYAAQKLSNHVTNNPFDDWIRNKIANYAILSLSYMGLSSNVEKNIAKLDQLTTAFSFSMEMNKKALKRTSFSLKSGDSSSHVELLRLDSAMGGFSSFLGEEDPDDDKDANAAMELTLLSLPLRPVTLFSSLGDLMEIYWSGAAQEKMTALQGTVLLQDDATAMSLENGVSIKMDIMGSLSFDLSGKADISIWTRTGSTLVENKAALLIFSHVAIPFGGGGMKVSSHLSAEAQLDVDTDVNLSSEDVLACIRMSQQKFMVEERHQVNGKEENYDIFIPGLTWNLNSKNNELCNKMNS